jgi:hypothetical protein
MKTFVLSACLAVVIGSAEVARALCGDVTGDEKKTTADALAVLRSAVGQTVNLVCHDGPSRLRYLNAFDCGSGSDLSTLEFNGFDFTADAFDYSPYESVDRESINDFHVALCGGDYYFDGPSYLPRNRSIYLYMVLADPEVYDFPGVEVPAFLVLFDEGIPADGATLASGSQGPVPGSGQEAAVFAGGLRRSAP